MPIPSSRRILRLPAVKAKVGLGHDSIYRIHDFPKPVKLSERAVGWFEDELDAWLASRRRTSAASDTAIG